MGAISLLILWAASAQDDFTHPGLLNSHAELEAVRARVEAGEEPWNSGLAQVPEFLEHAPRPVHEYRDGAGHKKDRHEPNAVALREDARAAYGSALRGFILRDPRHTRKAVAILNAWSSTLKKIGTSGDGSLSTSYGWPSLIFAAEIVAHTSDAWAPEDRARFRALLLELVWPATQKALEKDNGNNWRSFALFCRLAIAVHADDRARFDATVRLVVDQIGHYIYPDGQCLETPRDLWHAQMGMAPLAAAAEIAWHQGVDLYSAHDNRLLRGVEWHVPFILKAREGWPERFTSTAYPPAEKPREAGKIWPFYELAYAHYRDRRKLEAPQTERLLRTAGRPEGWERTGGWGTLTQAIGNRP